MLCLSRKSSHGFRSLRFLLTIGGASLIISTSAQADYSDSDAAIDQYFSEWVPVTSSANGQWIVSRYGNQLHVASTVDQKQKRSFPLPFGVNGLAVSDNGRRVAAFATRGCSAIIDLSTESGTKPKIRWLAGLGLVEVSKNLQPCTEENVARSDSGNQFFPPQRGIAISPDGRLVARIRTDVENKMNGYRRTVEVLEVDSNRVRRVLLFDGAVGPTHYFVQHLQFTHGSLGLLISATGVQHALWNVESGDLINMIPDQRSAPYFGYDFRSYVDPLSGALFTFEGTHIIRHDLSDCSKTSTLFAKLPESVHADALAVDPRQRWYALAAENKITVYQTRTIRKLAEWQLPARAGLLRASATGDMLFVTTRYVGAGANDGAAPSSEHRGSHGTALPRQIVFNIPLKELTLGGETKQSSGKQLKKCLLQAG